MDAFIAIMTLLNTVGVIATFLVALYTLREARDTRREEREAREAERREQAEYHAAERRIRDEERQQELEYRAAVRQEREREQQAEAEYRASLRQAREREHLAAIGQLIADVRAAATQLRDTQSGTWRMGQPVNYSYILDGPQSRLRAAVLLTPDLTECWKLADRREYPLDREITPQVVVDCIMLSERAFEEIEGALRNGTVPSRIEA